VTPQRLVRLRQLLRELADSSDDVLRDFAEKLGDREAQVGSTVIQLAGSSKGKRYGQQLDKLRRDTARDKSAAVYERRIDAGIARLRQAAASDRADAVADRLVSPGASAQHREAVKVAALEQGPATAQRVAELLGVKKS
jgi:hypothetical protein